VNPTASIIESLPDKPALRFGAASSPSHTLHKSHAVLRGDEDDQDRDGK
jgi:hypothetical protein